MIIYKNVMNTINKLTSLSSFCGLRSMKMNKLVKPREISKIERVAKTIKQRVKPAPKQGLLLVAVKSTGSQCKKLTDVLQDLPKL